MQATRSYSMLVCNLLRYCRARGGRALLAVGQARCCTRLVPCSAQTIISKNVLVLLFALLGLLMYFVNAWHKCPAGVAHRPQALPASYLRHHSTQGPTFAVLGIFKNEKRALDEWIDHYIWQGADFIVLIDDGSSDGYDISSHRCAHKVWLVSAPESHQQIAHYNSLGWPILQALGVDFAAVFDLDEFVFRKAGCCLKDEVVKAFVDRRVGQVWIPWTMFGSSGHVKQPPSLREHFTRSAVKLNYGAGKGIVRLSSLTQFSVHRHVVHGDTIEVDAIQLNHYAIQSREYFETVKMARGDVVSAQLDSVRDWSYFERYDAEGNETENVLLRDQLRAMHSQPETPC